MSLFRFIQWVNERWIVTVYGDGQQGRDFTYVEDIARGTLAGLKPLGYEVINLGSNGPVVLMDAVRLIEELVGRRAIVEYLPRHPADVQATWADITKAQKLLGWRPQTPLNNGLADLNAWCQKNRSWAKRIRTR